MITRKRRRNPPSPPSVNAASKRVRYSTRATRNRKEAVEESLTSQNSYKSSCYPVRAILAEKSDEFLIDWEDDLITGETYSPSWQPRGNVSTEAIESWRQKLNQPTLAGPSRGKNSRTRSPDTPRLVSISNTGSIFTKIINTTQRSEDTATARRSRTRSNLLVQVSQHSSLDRDQYLQYHSSISVHSLYSSAPPHEDSGLGESSPLSEASETTKSDLEGIVPDSQSPPGSSSYRPTASTSDDISGHRRLNTYYSLPRDSLDFTDNNLGSSSALHSLSDPIEDSSGLYVAESPENRFWSQRSASVPPSAFIESARSSSSRSSLVASLTRSASDPNPLVYSTQEDLSASLARSPDARQQLVVKRRRKYALPTLHNSQEVQAVEIPNSSESYSQDSILDLRPFTVLSEEDRASLRSRRKRRSSSLKASLTGDYDNGRVDFAIAEDTILDSQPTQTTESSALSERDPNSQPQRRTSIVPSHYPYFSSSKGTSETSSSLIFVDTSNLPITLDSRPPPRPLTLSTMSQTPQAQMGISPRASPGAAASGVSGKMSMKERLQTMRANSRAEAAARRQSAKEPGKSSPATVANDMAVQANQSQSPVMSQAQPPTSLSRPQSVLSPQVLSPKQTFPANPRGPEQTTTNMIPPAVSSPRKIAESIDEGSTTASTTQRETPLQSSAPLVQMESRIDTQPLEVPVEVPLPLRVSQSDTHTPTHPSKLSFHEELSVTQKTDSLRPTELGKMEFAIPLALSARVRDQYMAVINFNSGALHLIENDDISEGTIQVVNEMLARLNRVTTHIDLDDSTTANQKDDTTAVDLAEWAEHNSEKFRFLRCLLDRTRYDQVHLAIIAEPGRLLDIVETFLKATQVTYNRPDAYSHSEPGKTKGRVEVSLIASGKEGSSAVPKGADLVIALDASFRAGDTQVVKLRSHLKNVGQLAPVVHLLVNKSAEHVEKCIPKTMNPIERIRSIVSCLTQISQDVGHLQMVELSSSAAAEEVAAIVNEGGLELYWESFPRMAPIERIVSMEVSGEVDANASDIWRGIASSSALKRALDPNGSSAPEKRQRMTPVFDLTHISDSMTQGSQSTKSSMTNALQEARKDITSLKAARAKQESAIRAAHEREITLNTTLAKTQKQLDEYTTALDGLEDRYEERSRTLATLRGEKAALEAAATQSERRRETLTSDNAKLREERQMLQQEVQAVRTALLASPISAIADLERARAEARRYQADKFALEKKLEYAKNENEVIRNAYQTASNSAVESVNRIKDLEAENAILQTKARATVTDLAAISQRNENAMIRNQNAVLEASLKDREEVLRRKEEEIRELRRGRGMGTRGTSVKPGGSPRGSRAVSPAAGEPMPRTASKGLGSALRFGI